MSQICKSFLLRQPITLYVSLSITRDYLFIDDAGDMVVALLDSLDSQPSGTSSVRILSSGTNTMLASLLQTCWRVLRRPLRVITVQSDLSGLQPKDLRVRPMYPILRSGPTTPLAVGVRRTFDDLLMQFQAGALNSTLAK